jgi:pyruvate dehydrogenase E2 component (dihydrolipoamide acetyltransferase)
LAVTDIVKLAGIRGIIAQKMAESLEKTAQLSFFCDIDVTALSAAREAWKAAGVKIGYEDLIAKAIAGVMVDFPAFNGVETPAGVELHDEVHVGCAIALPGALVAPAISNVAQLSLPEIATIRQDLVARARLGKLTIAELTGATVTITNLGLTRVDFLGALATALESAAGLGPMA